MPDPLGPGGWAYWRERFTTADAERTHLRAEIERLRAALDSIRQWDSLYGALPDKLAQQVIRANEKQESKEK